MGFIGVITFIYIIFSVVGLFIFLSFSMSTITMIYMTFLNPGDHLVITNSCYGGTFSFISKYFKKYNIEVTFVDQMNVMNYKEAMIPGKTKMFYGETPSNPTLSLVDMKSLANLGKELDILTVIDSTFASPIVQNPLGI